MSLHNKPIGFECFLSDNQDGSYTNHFAHLFESLSMEDYTWYVTYSENDCSVPQSPHHVDHFLPEGVYSSKELLDLITERPQYYILQLSMYAVPSGVPFAPERIKVYKDYLESAAELAFFSGDSIVSFYAKDEAILKNIFASAKHHYTNEASESCIHEPTLITAGTDGRTEFYV